MSPVTDRQRDRGRILKGGRLGDDYFVWSPEGGLVKVWVESDGEQSYLCAQAQSRYQGPARRFLKDMGWSRLMTISLLLPLGVLAFFFWESLSDISSWGNSAAGVLLSTFGVVLIETALWRALNFRAKDSAALRVLNNLTALFVRKGEVSKEEDSPLIRHRLEVMERIKKQKEASNG